MDTRRIGSLDVSVVGVGCNNFGRRIDEAATREAVHAALDAGVSFFDTADIYGEGTSEEFLGRALGPRRGEVVLATKFGMKMDDSRQGAHPDYIRRAVEDSLRRLGTDRIDLYQLHAPDPATPLEETVAVLDQLVTAGKVLYAGTSNFAGWQLVDAHWRAARHNQVRLVSTQVPYSLLQREAERELLPAAHHCSVGVIACVALARGLLAGAFDQDTDVAQLSSRRRSFLTDGNRARLAVIDGFAQKRGLTTAQVSLQAVLAHPDVNCVVVGASTVQQVIANAKAVSTPMRAADRAELLAALRHIDDR